MNRRSRRWIGRVAALALVAAVVAVLPASMQTALAATEVETELETLSVGRGDSLSVLLYRADVGAVDADRISRALQKRTNLRHLSIGREVRVLFRVEGAGQRVPVAVSVETRPGRFVEATRTAKGRYSARRTTIPLTRPIPLSEVAFDRDGRAVTVRRNQTIMGILQRHGVDGTTADAVVDALRTVFDPRDLMPGQTLTIAAGHDADGAPQLRGIALQLEDERAVAVVRTDGGGFTARHTTAAALRAAALETVAPPQEDTAPPPREDTAAAAMPPQKPTRQTTDEAETASADRPSGEDQLYEGPQHTVDPALFELSRTLRSGRTLMDLLLDADVRRPEADALVQSLRRVFNPRRLPAGITVRVAKRPVPGFEPRIAWLDIELPQGRRILVERGEKGRFSSRITKEPRPTLPRAVASVAEVDQAASGPVPVAKPAPSADEPPPPAVAAPRTTEALPPAASRITVRSGDTLMAILRRQGIDRVEADRAIQAARKLFNLRRLRIGQEITLVTGIDETGADTLKTVALRVGDDRYVRVTRAASGRFEAARVDRLGLLAAPLQRVSAASTAPEGEQRRNRAMVADRGQVMSGAFVAAAAPLATVSSGPSPRAQRISTTMPSTERSMAPSVDSSTTP